jgi:hypothetical protein
MPPDFLPTPLSSPGLLIGRCLQHYRNPSGRASGGHGQNAPLSCRKLGEGMSDLSRRAAIAGLLATAAAGGSARAADWPQKTVTWIVP